ncbi:MAG: methyltransferase [Planctomycetota bacterium]|jgi:hypothetical protein
MPRKWTSEEVLDIAGGFRPTCVLFTAAELNIFSLLKAKSMGAQALADELKIDIRATNFLLDALAAMGFLTKQNKEYKVCPEVAELLSEDSAKSILPAIRHSARCLRRWVRLPEVMKEGGVAEVFLQSIRSDSDGLEAFIGAMDNFSAPVADDVISKLGRLNFSHLLDVGGGSGTWTIAFLRAYPQAKATIFDLGEVIPMAQKRIAQAGLADRVRFVGGDFYKDELPKEADFVWLSAIAHQNSRGQNQELFAKIYSVLKKRGMLALRDVVMDESRTRPEAGALFAINMLVSTEAGGTYTFEEFQADILGAGFAEAALIWQDEFMNSLICAKKL